MEFRQMPWAAAVAMVVSAVPSLGQVKDVEPYIAVVSSERAALRSGPSDMHYSVAELKRGQLVRVDGEDAAWARVAYPTTVPAFVKADDVSHDSAAGTVRVTRPTRLAALSALRPEGSWQALLPKGKELAAGTTLKVLATVRGADGKAIGYRVPAPDAARAFVESRHLRRATPDEAKAFGAAPAPTPAPPATTSTATPSTPSSAPAGADRSLVQPIIPPTPESKPTPAPAATPVSTPAHPPVATPTPASAPSDPSATTLSGVLINDISAIGGETTGWGVRDSANSITEVDVSGVLADAQANVGKPVSVTGVMTTKAYVTRGEVRTLLVKEILAPGAVIDQAKSPGVAPVTPPATPREPTPAERRRGTLAQLESAFAKVRAQPADQAEYEELSAEISRTLGELGQEPSDAGTRRQLELRQQLLQLYIDRRNAVRKLEEAKRAANADLQRTDQFVTKVQTSRVYNVVGRLQASSVYDGRNLPEMFRVVSVGTGLPKTLGYIRPDDAMGIANKVNQLVGVVGSSAFDESLKLDIITPVRIDVLQSIPTPARPSTPAPTLEPIPGQPLPTGVTEVK